MAKKISKKFSFIGENIRRIRQAKSISQAEFGSLLGLGRPAVGAYEEGRSEPKIETIIQIAKHFSISIDDLLTKQLSVSEIYSMDRLNKKLDQVHGAEKKSVDSAISLVKTNQFLDYVIRHKDKEFLKSLETIPNISENHATMAFEMKGNDMENQGLGLNPGDILFCQRTDLKKWKSLKGHAVVVVTDDEVFCKRLEDKKHNVMIFMSDAGGVQKLEKEASDIAEIWKVVGYYSARTESQSQLENRIHQLEEMIKNLND